MESFLCHSLHHQLFRLNPLSGLYLRLDAIEQTASHPIDIYHPEGEYLKGLVLHLE